MREARAPAKARDRIQRRVARTGNKRLIERTLRTDARSVQHVRIDHGRSNILYPVRYRRGRRIAILQLSTNNLRPIQAAALELQDAVEKMSPAEFRRLEIPR